MSDCIFFYWAVPEGRPLIGQQMVSRYLYDKLPTLDGEFERGHFQFEEISVMNNDSAIRNVSRVNVIEIGNSYLDNVSPRDVSYCGIIV